MLKLDDKTLNYAKERDFDIVVSLNVYSCG